MSSIQVGSNRTVCTKKTKPVKTVETHSFLLLANDFLIKKRENFNNFYIDAIFLTETDSPPPPPYTQYLYISNTTIKHQSLKSSYHQTIIKQLLNTDFSSKCVASDFLMS